MIDKKIYKEKIDEIMQVLSNDKIAVSDTFGLLSGLGGRLLFIFEYCKLHNNDKGNNQILEKAIDNLINMIIEQEYPIHTYCAGISGIGWLLCYLERRGKKTEISPEIDDFLCRWISTDIQKQNYDFLHGFIGTTYYFICKNKNEKNREKIISSVLDYLYHGPICHVKDNSRYWINWNLKREKECNISLSHGITAIVAVLLKAVSLEYGNRTKIVTMIEQTINFILKQEINVDLYDSYFSYLSINSSDTIVKSRLAWCYGDLGIAVTLYNAGVKLNRSDWINKAMEILLFAARNRRNLEQNSVFDACVCHGTAGIGHIFYRMWWNTHNPDFKEAADYWFERTIEFAKFKDGIAGYKIWSTNGHYDNDYCGILEGVAGIGLALISYAYETEPTWDECLLLS